MFKHKLFSIQLFFILLVISVSKTYAQEEDKIHFEKGTWKEILAKAKTENKPIFVDFYTEWCGPCKMMSKQVFTDKEVATYYNKNFISAKINAETQEAELVGKIGITAYPSLYYFTADGQVINKQIGALNAKQFLQFGESVISMVNIAKDLPKIKADYEKKPKDLVATQKYIQALTFANNTKLADSIAQIYLPKIAEKDLEKSENWEIVKLYVKDFESREFQYIMKNPKKFIETYGEEAYSNFFFTTMDYNMTKAVKSQKHEELVPVKKYYLLFNQQMGSESKDEYHSLTIDMFYYRAVGNKEKYYESMTTQTDKFLLEDSNELIKRVFDIIQNYEGRKELEKAVTWSQKMFKNKDDSMANYAYATVLFRQGNKPEASKYLEIAAKKNDNPELDQYIQALKQELAK